MWLVQVYSEALPQTNKWTPQPFALGLLDPGAQGPRAQAQGLRVPGPKDQGLAGENAASPWSLGPGTKGRDVQNLASFVKDRAYGRYLGRRAFIPQEI